MILRLYTFLESSWLHIFPIVHLREGLYQRTTYECLSMQFTQLDYHKKQFLCHTCRSRDINKILWWFLEFMSFWSNFLYILSSLSTKEKDYSKCLHVSKYQISTSRVYWENQSYNKRQNWYRIATKTRCEPS